MLAVDYIILNRDRHGANIEVLRNPKKKTIRLFWTNREKKRSSML